jgi:hypothetical protein
MNGIAEATAERWVGFWRPSPKAPWRLLLGRQPPLPGGDMAVVKGPDRNMPAAREQDGRPTP